MTDSTFAMAALMPAQLRQRLIRRQCVAFVGAGFSMACGMPRWPDLLLNMLAGARDALSPGHPSLETCKTAIDRGNYTLAASILRECLAPADMDEAIRRNFGFHRLEQSGETDKKRMLNRMMHLACAPWAGIITTNYDELIEHGLNQWSRVERVSASGTDPRLGVILNSTPSSGLFFVKLHGSVSSSEIVLSTDEYDRAYIATPQVSSFLTGVMLRYHLVFVGCSLEDEIVRMRRDLTRRFRGILPSAYALLQETADNKARQSWLRNLAQIESMFYPQADRTHDSVDRFLREAAESSDPVTAAANPASGLSASTAAQTVQRYRAEPPLKRLFMAGLENQRIVALASRMPDCALHHRDLVNPARTGTPEGDLLSSLSPSELTYRALFLISVGLLDEGVGADGERIYQVGDPVNRALADLRTSGLANRAKPRNAPRKPGPDPLDALQRGSSLPE